MDPNSSSWRNAPTPRSEVALNRVSLSGASCPYCGSELDCITVCTNCNSLVCPSAWKTYRAPDQTLRKWFSCPCGQQGWAGDGPPPTTAPARKCDDPASPPRRSLAAPAAKALPAPAYDLLRLPAPKK